MAFARARTRLRGATAVSLLEAIVLGIVQGLTEFLPISSTAHLRIVPAFAGWEDPGAAFTAVTQLGTLAAVLLYFRRDLLEDRAGLAGAASAIRDASRNPRVAARLVHPRRHDPDPRLRLFFSATRSRPEPVTCGSSARP